MSRSNRKAGRKGRRGDHAGAAHLVPGARAVHELLSASPERVRSVYVEQGREFEDLAALANAAGVAWEIVDRDQIERMTGPGLARGVVASAASPLQEGVESLLERLDDAPPTAFSGRRMLLALDGVVDPRNLGAILRSAEFFGAAGAFWARDRSAPLSPVAVRASAGASERLPVAQVTNLSRALALCTQHEVWTVGTVVEGGHPLREAAQGTLPDTMVLVMGSEGAGLRRLTRDRCDYLVSIDRDGGVGSLNVSTAAAVALSWLA